MAELLDKTRRERDWRTAAGEEVASLEEMLAQLAPLVQKARDLESRRGSLSRGQVAEHGDIPAGDEH